MLCCSSLTIAGGPGISRAELHCIAHRGHRSPSSRQHLECVDVERAIQFVGGALRTGSAQLLVGTRNLRLFLRLLEQRALNILARDGDRRPQLDARYS